MKFSEWLFEVGQDFKAWRRGEVRVAPRGVRGRVYTRKSLLKARGISVKEAKNEVNTAGKLKVTLEAKVIRANGDVEDLGVISQKQL